MTVSVCRKQTGPQDAGNNLWKSHFIMCHVTKYSTIRGVFQQPWPPWPGVSPTAIFNEERALGTSLAGCLWVVLSRENSGKRGVRSSWTSAKTGLGRVTKRGEAKTHLPPIADFDFVRRRPRHFDWSIYCQSSSVWRHVEKKQISETK